MSNFISSGTTSMMLRRADFIVCNENVQPATHALYLAGLVLDVEFEDAESRDIEAVDFQDNIIWLQRKCYDSQN